MASIDDYTPDKGKLTFINEGHEQGPFHSRKLHVPSNDSGLTIGRGYDMKERKQSQIQSELVAAGVSLANAEKIAKAASLKGVDAKKFIVDNNLSDFEIDMAAQKKLFELVYQEKERYAKHLCTKPDVTKKFGECNWDNLDSNIRELVVDLTYRGDYTPNLRAKMQKAIITQDFDALVKSLSNKANFSKIDNNRFNARLDAMKKIAEVKRIHNSIK